MTSPEHRGPLAVARRAQLLDALRREGTVRVSDLTDALGVTAATVRRDIAHLVREGHVRRVHGGATLAPPPDGEAFREATPDVGEQPPEPLRRWPEPPAPRSDATPTRTIAMLVPSLDYYWPDVVRGAEEAARGCGFGMVLRGSSYESDDDRPQLSRLIESTGVQGLLVAPNMNTPTAGSTLSWLTATGLPTVLVERNATVSPHHQIMESVVSDHALGAGLAVQHLASLGHRRVGLVLSRQSPTSPHIRRGWLEAAAECGLPVDDTVDAVVPSPRSPGWDENLDAILDRCQTTKTTALLVHADAEAMGLVQRFEERRLSVPHDLSVVAYDDEVAGLFSPALTAVRPPRRSIGRAAVDLLTARIVHPDRPTHRVIITPTLYVRQSSAPPAKP